MFHYKIKNNDTVYKVKKSSLKLSKTLESIAKNNNADTPRDAIEFNHVTTTDLEYNITYNLPIHHDFINEYFTIWCDKIKSENYIKIQPINCANPANILTAEDNELIERYLFNNLNNPDNQNKEYIIKVYNKINCLNALICTADKFMEMDGLTNKLLAYIATIIWTCGLPEVNNIRMVE